MRRTMQHFEKKMNTDATKDPIYSNALSKDKILSNQSCINTVDLIQTMKLPDCFDQFLKSNKLTHPTRVQEFVWPIIELGYDVLTLAPTGRFGFMVLGILMEFL